MCTYDHMCLSHQLVRFIVYKMSRDLELHLIYVIENVPYYTFMTLYSCRAELTVCSRHITALILFPPKADN